MNATQLLQALISGLIDLEEYKALCRRNGIRNVLVCSERPTQRSAPKREEANISWEKVAEWTMS